MRFLPIALLLALGACGNAAQTAQTEAVVCQVDGAFQPVTAAVIAAAAPAAGPAVAIDTLLVHPLVVAYCASLGGVPAVATVTTPAVTPITAPVAPAPAVVPVGPATITITVAPKAP